MKDLKQITEEEYKLAIKNWRPKYGNPYDRDIKNNLRKLSLKKWTDEQRIIIKRTVIYLINKNNEISLNKFSSGLPSRKCRDNISN